MLKDKNFITISVHKHNVAHTPEYALKLYLNIQWLLYIRTHHNLSTHTHKRTPILNKFKITLLYHSGPGSSTVIATGYGLDGPGIESRWRARFSAPVQAGPEAHPSSYTMGTGSFPAVKSGRVVTLTLHPLLVPLSRKDRAILLFPLWTVRPVQSLSACTKVHFTFHYIIIYSALILLSIFW
jgi:hypothetical protein